MTWLTHWEYLYLSKYHYFIVFVSEWSWEDSFAPQQVCGVYQRLALVIWPLYFVIFILRIKGIMLS